MVGFPDRSGRSWVGVISVSVVFRGVFARFWY